MPSHDSVEARWLPYPLGFESTRGILFEDVDNRTYKRIAYQALNRAPTQEGIPAFFCRLQAALQERGLVLRGITTDGSSPYPVPIAEVFGDVPHQVCPSLVLGLWGRTEFLVISPEFHAFRV